MPKRKSTKFTMEHAGILVALEKDEKGASDSDKEKGKVKRNKNFQILNNHFRVTKNIGLLMNLELPIAVELGRVSMLAKDILELCPGAVIKLNKFSGEPVDLYVNGKKFAEGELVVVNHNLGVRLTALVGPDEKVSCLE